MRVRKTGQGQTKNQERSQGQTENREYKFDLCEMFPKAKEAKGKARYKLRKFEEAINKAGFLIFDSKVISTIYPHIFPNPKDVDNFSVRTLGMSFVELKAAILEMEGNRKCIESFKNFFNQEIERGYDEDEDEDEDKDKMDYFMALSPRRLTRQITALLLQETLNRKGINVTNFRVTIVKE